MLTITILSRGAPHLVTQDSHAISYSRELHSQLATSLSSEYPMAINKIVVHMHVANLYSFNYSFHLGYTPTLL